MLTKKDYFDHDGQRERREQAAFDRMAGLLPHGGVNTDSKPFDAEAFLAGRYVLDQVRLLAASGPMFSIGDRLKLLGKVADGLGLRLIEAEAQVELDGQ